MILQQEGRTFKSSTLRSKLHNSRPLTWKSWKWRVCPSQSVNRHSERGTSHLPILLAVVIKLPSAACSQWEGSSETAEKAQLSRGAHICQSASQPPQPFITHSDCHQTWPRVQRTTQQWPPTLPQNLLPSSCVGNESQLFYTSLFSFLSETPPPLSLKSMDK